MSVPHVQSGEVFSLPLGTELATAKTTTLAKTNALEAIRLVVPAGKEIPPHSVPGEITVQCLEGRVLLTANGKSQELAAGQFLYLAGSEPHALKGIVDSSLLLTILTLKKPSQRRLDGALFDLVQEASEESFPASDPPARQPIIRP